MVNCHGDRACGTVVDELAGKVSVSVVSRMRGSFLAANAG